LDWAWQQIDNFLNTAYGQRLDAEFRELFLKIAKSGITRKTLNFAVHKPAVLHNNNNNNNLPKCVANHVSLN